MRQQIPNLPNRFSLLNDVKRSLRTTCIGAINQFEQMFGYLWGKGKKLEELTENEAKFLRMWRFTREKIMDCEGNESRRMDKQFDKYVIQYNAFQYKFKVRGSLDS